MKTTDHISPNQINMYIRCPAQYYFRYLKGMKVPPSGAMHLGISIDRGCSHNFTQKIESHEDLPKSEVVDFYVAAFEENQDDVEWQDEKPLEVRDSGIGMIGLYHKERMPSIQPAEVQEKKSIQIENVGELVCVPDVYTDKGIIIDQKTTKRTPNEKKIEFHHDIQMSLYQLCAMAEGLKVNGLALDFMVRTKTPRLLTLSFTRTQEDIDFMVRQVHRIKTAIDKDIFYPNKGSFLCSPGLCGYWNECKSTF